MEITADQLTAISEIKSFLLKNQAPLEFFILRIFIDILCQDRLFPFIKTFGDIDD